MGGLDYTFKRWEESREKSKMSFLKVTPLPLAICLFLTQVYGKPSPRHLLVETKDNNKNDYNDYNNYKINFGDKKGWGKWTTGLPKKYVDLYNKLTEKQKWETEQIIQWHKFNTKEKILEAAKPGGILGRVFKRFGKYW